MEVSIGKVSTTAGKIKNVMMPVTNAIIGVGAAALATVPATEELRADLSRLDTNAQQAGVGLEATRQAFMDLNAVSGETDSSIEAVSNLLQAGFTESNLQKAVEGLANAAISFPDTIRIESLADSLQETLATGEATGQFAELLDRMGIGAETFSEGLSMCTTEIDKQNYALNALVGGPLRDTYNSWMQNNEQLVESRDASLELQTALAQLAEQLVPVVTTIAEFASSFLNWFTSLDDGAQGAIVAVGLLIAAIGPLAGVVETVSAVMPTLINLFSGLNTKMLGISIVAAVLVGLFAAVAGAWEDMSGLEKVVSVLGLVAAAALTAAIAVGAFQSALTIGIAAAGIVAGIVAVVAAINSAQQRAEQATQNLERQSSRSSYSVPAFANGGVVPPNDPFLAVLGDNRTEPEVVAPYSTIKQAAGEALAERGNSGGTGRGDVYLDGTKVGLLEALAAQTYGKVYIMLGVNETGYPSSRTFAEAYGALIDHVRALQPDAVIYVQSLVPVNPEKCRSHHQPYYVTNEKIQAYTDLLIPLAEEKRVVYVDVAAALTGGTGVLPGELTSDGVHFTRSGYVQWLDYLKTHTVDAAAYQAGQAATQQLDEKGTDEI